MRRCRLPAERTALSIAFLALWGACRPSDAPPTEGSPAAGAEETWVGGLQAARQERAELTDAMRALFQVSLEARTATGVELTLANLSDRALAEYGGLLHLRDSEGERVCTLWLSEQASLPPGEAPGRPYDVEGAFAADTTPVSELQGTWDPYRLVFADGEVMAKPWPTQSWWPWCQSFLSRRAE